MADHKGVLPAAPFTTPMPAVKPPKDHFDLVNNAPLAAALEKRGVQWPLNVYAPGLYLQTCGDCGERHMADKRAMRCLPCAVVLAIGAAADHRDRFDQGVAEGRHRATADVKRALGIPEVPAPVLREFRIRSNRIENPDVTVKAASPGEALSAFLREGPAGLVIWPAFPAERRVRIDGPEGTTVFSTDAKDRWCEIHPDDLHRGWIEPKGDAA